MSTNERNEKKIEKYLQLLNKEIQTINACQIELQNNSNEKEIGKTEKRLKTSREYCVFFIQKMYEVFGADEGDVLEYFDENEMLIIREIFPYGLEKKTVLKQNLWDIEISSLKKSIKKVKIAREKYPPYDKSASMKERLTSELFQVESKFGEELVRHERNMPDYIWLYSRDFEKSVEFTPEERDILEYCYNLGIECSNSLLGGGKISQKIDLYQARKYAEGLRDKVFDGLLKVYDPTMSKAERKEKSSKYSKGYLEFASNSDNLIDIQKKVDAVKYNDIKIPHIRQSVENNKVNSNTVYMTQLANLIVAYGLEEGLYVFVYAVHPNGKKAAEFMNLYTLEELELD